ncbi:MAG: DHHA1 domain-containing protein [Chloroflexota bacterium]|nr:DHHA1 domain-containing protein [Chloroflexota bacterium]
MAGSDRAYYDDSYTARFTARILERFTHAGRPAVVLDRTYFYPTGGGQPNDLGLIDGAAVVDVLAREGDKAVVHVLERDIASDDPVCEINWARRFDYMQHHTGQHILTQAFVQTVNAQTVGFHLSVDTVTIDLDKIGLSDAQIAAAEDEANRIVVENHPVMARIIDRSDMDGVRARRIPEKLLTAGLRIIDIDGYDVTACGGTHVRTTGEIGMIKVVRVEKRGDKARIEFKCGGRALRDYRLKTDVLTRIAAALTVGTADTADAVIRLQDEYKTIGRALKTASTQLIEAEAHKILLETPVIDGVRIVKHVYRERDAGDLKLLASYLVAAEGVIGLLGLVGDKSLLVFARSANLTHDMNALLKVALATFGGRGGGQPNLAQGGGVPASVETIIGALERAAESLTT